jgi:hypothetical protein
MKIFSILQSMAKLKSPERLILQNLITLTLVRKYCYEEYLLLAGKEFG